MSLVSVEVVVLGAGERATLILFRARRLFGTEHVETALFSGRLVGELSIKGVTKEIPETFVVTPGENR